jgi:SAM-dependent methyltransferase
MSTPQNIPVDLETLRTAISEEYDAVACDPKKGYHFHTGREHAERMGYKPEWLDGVAVGSVDSFAGTGNPFAMGALRSGERVVDVCCGAGIDSMIASRMVGPAGHVVGIDMTKAMVDKAADGAKEQGIDNVEFRKGYGEDLPVEAGWADVVISNGSLNLMPDKAAALTEMARVLKPTGRLQIADIIVQKPVSENAKKQIDLWTG